MKAGQALVVAAAGFLAGAVNTIAGGGSLISFPALLATGFAALPANVTNTVGLVPGYLGGSLAYRRELTGQRRRVQDLAATALAGAGGGTALLLLTPAAAFRAVVPWLVLAAALLLLVQPRLGRWLRRGGGGPRHRPLALHLAVFLGGVYGAYFGAALGVLLLALLGLLLPDDLQRLNALKGLMSLLISILAAAVYIVFAPVDWAAAGLLAGASLLGGHTGGLVARRVRPATLRLAVVTFGMAVAVALLV